MMVTMLLKDEVEATPIAKGQFEFSSKTKHLAFFKALFNRRFPQGVDIKKITIQITSLASGSPIPTPYPPVSEGLLRAVFNVREPNQDKGRTAIQFTVGQGDKTAEIWLPLPYPHATLLPPGMSAIGISSHKLFPNSRLSMVRSYFIIIDFVSDNKMAEEVAEDLMRVKPIKPEQIVEQLSKMTDKKKMSDAFASLTSGGHFGGDQIRSMAESLGITVGEPGTTNANPSSTEGSTERAPTDVDQAPIATSEPVATNVNVTNQPEGTQVVANVIATSAITANTDEIAV